MAIGDVLDRGVIRWLTEEIDGDNGPRPQASFFRICNPCLQARRVDVEVVVSNIDEAGRCTDLGRRFGCRDEGEGRDEDGIAGADIFGHQHHGDRIGAIGRGDRAGGARERRKGCFEFADFRAEDHLAVIENSSDRLFDT